eukprot:CAMPEP_0181310450 /NCGR_PEP_ID=MMETSP1101-20121128/12592_1 /TAXON_ID=46948 /ORGANISM="Rhodomonas abbreviata, Strain Caron Lab Isolate" /LENGTH=309 /DNA_ID=CAMNT_0023417079 /DNA_START=90 /DNA_END=1019 /DNA_ORIENTATION=-
MAVPVRTPIQDTAGVHMPQSPPDGKSNGVVFDRNLAEKFVNFSRICYCDRPSIQAWNCSTCKSVAPFELEEMSNETYEHVGVYVGYWRERDMVLVVFRGTDYLINWIQDLYSYGVDANYPQCNATEEDDGLGSFDRKPACKVHSGFFDDWKSVQYEVLNATQRAMAAHPTAQVWVTGHSMGGALAVFCALDVRLKLNVPFVGLYTFGQPRVGNKAFAEFTTRTIPNTMRVTHQDDVVPHLPPMTSAYLPLTAFHHEATEVWQTGPQDDIFKVCDASGEDPTCADSLPSWDRSVSAHLHYLGWQMHCEGQ